MQEDVSIEILTTLQDAYMEIINSAEGSIDIDAHKPDRRMHMTHTKERCKYIYIKHYRRMNTKIQSIYKQPHRRMHT